MSDGSLSVQTVIQEQSDDRVQKPDLPDLRELKTTCSRVDEDIAAQKEQRSKLGDFAAAKCVDFERPAEGVVNYQYKMPDGTVEPVRYDVTEDMPQIDALMNRHNADCTMDMVGTERSSIYTDDGWELWEQPIVGWNATRNPAESNWMLGQYVDSDNQVLNVNIVVPTISLSIIAALVLAELAHPGFQLAPLHAAFQLFFINLFHMAVVMKNKKRW